MQFYNVKAGCIGLQFLELRCVQDCRFAPQHLSLCSSTASITAENLRETGMERAIGVMIDALHATFIVNFSMSSQKPKDVWRVVHAPVHRT